MLFYSDLLKKVKEEKLESLKESYVFRLKITKILPHIIILLMVLVMSPFLVLIYKEEGLGPFVFLVPLLGLISIAQIVNSFKFKFEIKDGSLFYRTIEIKLDDIKTCQLKYGVLPRGKKMETFIDIVTVNKEEKIIPLHMGNKVLFVLVLKEILGNRFSVLEEK